RVPRRVAVDTHRAARRGLDERLELLAARVLLHVRLQGLHRAVDGLPRLGRDLREGHRRPGDVRQGRREGHQNFCPQMMWPRMRKTANAVRIAVSRRKNSVAGPASSVVYPPKLSTG